MNSIGEILSGSLTGKQAEIRGWVYRIRSSGSLCFIVVRDSSGIVQAVGTKETLGEARLKELANLTIESSIALNGTVKEDKRSSGGYEIQISDFKIFQRNENYPITKDKGEEFLLDIRHLWLRSREMTSIMKIRSTVFKAFSDFFYNEGYYQTQGPMMVATATEGGSTLFKLDFFGEEISLAQSSQFYLEVMMFSLEKVFTIAPSFRAEKSRTRRHLTEYWHAEAEAAWYGNEDMMRDEERMIEYIIRQVLEKNREDLIFLKRDLSKLENIRAPFPRMRYSELMKKAGDWGLGLKYGDDLGADEERAITVHFDKPVFVTHYPDTLKPTFYHREDPETPGELLCHDLLAPEGYGEIIGGGERIWNLADLEENLKKYNLNPEDYYWYVDLRKYGSVPHSGFGLGLDRVIWWICGLETIRDAIPFPRTIRRTRP